jgi:hypothetical protein
MKEFNRIEDWERKAVNYISNHFDINVFTNVNTYVSNAGNTNSFYEFNKIRVMTDWGEYTVPLRQFITIGWKLKDNPSFVARRALLFNEFENRHYGAGQ